MKKSLKELSNSIWPTIIADSLIINQAEGQAWIDVERGDVMLNYLSSIDSKKDYSLIIAKVKEGVKKHKLMNGSDEATAKKYTDAIGKDAVAYDTIKNVFKKPELQKIIKQGGERKRNIFCWTVATLLLEYVPDKLQA